MVSASLFWIVMLFAGVAVVSGQSLPGVAELPHEAKLRDPLTFRDGSRVASKIDWDRRRAELKQLFQHYEYGTLPPTPESIVISAGEVASDETLNARVQPIKVTMTHRDRTLVLEIRLILPNQKKATYPVLVRGTFGRPGGATSRPAGAPTSLPAGMMSPTDNIRMITSRGYAIAEFPLAQIALDNRDHAREGGVYALFPESDAGTLMAWAWGFSRAIDALHAIPSIDTGKVIVTGHSRWGKAALLAGAFDDRIALTAPSHSGAGGTAPYRFLFKTEGKDSEALHNIVGAFPYWFKSDFDQFVDHVDQLPFDQHELRALVAPRGQVSTEGTLDSWVNPEGSQLTFEAAQRVYEFLGTTDNLGIRYRPVGHIPNDGDVLDFADHLFFEKPLPDAFDERPYPNHDTQIEVGPAK